MIVGVVVAAGIVDKAARSFTRALRPAQSRWVARSGHDLQKARLENSGHGQRLSVGFLVYLIDATGGNPADSGQRATGVKGQRGAPGNEGRGQGRQLGGFRASQTMLELGIQGYSSTDG